MDILGVIQVIIGASVAVRLLVLGIPAPLFCLFLLLESIRQGWMLALGNPFSSSYARTWTQTEAVSILLLILAASEVYVRAASFYAGPRRVYVYLAGVLGLIGITIAIASCFPSQVEVKWSNLPVRNLMLMHQLTYASICFWMLLFLIASAFAPNHGAIGYRKHARLLALFSGFDAAVVLAANNRLAPGVVIIPLLTAGTTVVLSMWFLVRKRDFATLPRPADAAASTRLRGLLEALEQLRDPGGSPGGRTRGEAPKEQ